MYYSSFHSLFQSSFIAPIYYRLSLDPPCASWLGFSVQTLGGFRVQGLRLRVQGFRGLGFRVYGSGI